MKEDGIDGVSSCQRVRGESFNPPGYGSSKQQSSIMPARERNRRRTYGTVSTTVGQWGRADGQGDGDGKILIEKMEITRDPAYLHTRATVVAVWRLRPSATAEVYASRKGSARRASSRKGGGRMHRGDLIGPSGHTGERWSDTVKDPG